MGCATESQLILFNRLGVDGFRLARRYHPDRGNSKSHELMANIFITTVHRALGVLGHPNHPEELVLPLCPCDVPYSRTMWFA